VIARTSVMGYRGKAVDVTVVGRELGVDHLVEGTVRHDADRARIGLRLVNVASRASVWDSTFDTPLSDVFATETDVAQRVAEALRLKLGGGAPSGGARVAVHPEAYDLVLRGRYLLTAQVEGRVRGVVDSAITLLARATEVDPGYAVAHAELADALTQKLFEEGPNPALQERAWLELGRALAIDSTLSLAYDTSARCSSTPVRRGPTVGSAPSTTTPGSSRRRWRNTGRRFPSIPQMPLPVPGSGGRSGMPAGTRRRSESSGGWTGSSGPRRSCCSTSTGTTRPGRCSTGWRGTARPGL
jgi:hypothetical protein